MRVPGRPQAWAIPLGALVLSAALVLLDGRGSSLAGWLPYLLLVGLGLVLLEIARRGLGVDATASQAAGAALLIRLLVGVALAALLPVYGYPDNQVTRAGYLFFDAFVRDQQAWDLAGSGQPLWVAFQGEYSGDQYGGMLALSAAIYRYLSPDTHRPALLLVLTATAGALGVLFLWRVARDGFGNRVAGIAAWIFALYPEGIFLSSSQMREPFLMTGVAIALFGLMELRTGELKRSVWLLVAVAVLLLFSPSVALATLALTSVAWAIDSGRRFTWQQAVLFGILLLLGALVVFSILAEYPSLARSGPWRIWIQYLENNFGFQAHLLERSSGWVQKIFTEAGERWQTAIVIIYGIARPVLPATLVEPAPWIWRVIGSLRAAGWYALAPLLVYAATRSLHSANRPLRAQLVWMSLAVWLWVGIAAFVAGGDQIDNPRYRTILLAWQALLAAWGWVWARTKRDPWLGRWLLVEGVFVLFFTQWYISRYYRVIGRLFFWQMVAAILVISALILGGGWLLDRFKATVEP